MAARPIASGTVSFGLVAIPIKLYSTGDYSASVQLNWLHGKCRGRLKQQYYCPKDDEVVGRDDMIKGYAVAKDQYVVFSEEELNSLTVKATHSVEITEFVPVTQVDPIFFEKSYYLGPNKGGERPYRLLAAAMRQTGRVALGRYATRGKNYLVLLRPYAEGLIMQQLRYVDEIKAFTEVPLGEAEVKEAELNLAVQLIEQTATDEFHPENYEDEVRHRLLAMVEQKIQGQEVTTAPAEEPKAQIIDLMEALKASLGGEGEAAAARKPPRRSPRVPAAAEKAAAAGGKRKAAKK